MTNLHPIFEQALAPFMAPAEVIAAEYTVGSKTRCAVLTINRIVDGRREKLSTHEVDGKREARRIAATVGATPWNF